MYRYLVAAEKKQRPCLLSSYKILEKKRGAALFIHSLSKLLCSRVSGLKLPPKMSATQGAGGPRQSGACAPPAGRKRATGGGAHGDLRKIFGIDEGAQQRAAEGQRARLAQRALINEGNAPADAADAAATSKLSVADAHGSSVEAAEEPAESPRRAAGAAND